MDELRFVPLEPISAHSRERRCEAMTLHGRPREGGDPYAAARRCGTDSESRNLGGYGSPPSRRRQWLGSCQGCIKLRSGFGSQAFYIIAGVARDQLEIGVDPDKGRLAVDHELNGLVAALDRPLLERDHVLVAERAGIGIGCEQADIDRLIERRFGFLSVAGE